MELPCREVKGTLHAQQDSGAALLTRLSPPTKPVHTFQSSDPTPGTLAQHTPWPQCPGSNPTPHLPGTGSVINSLCFCICGATTTPSVSLGSRERHTSSHANVTQGRARSTVGMKEVPAVPLLSPGPSQGPQRVPETSVWHMPHSANHLCARLPLLGGPWPTHGPRPGIVLTVAAQLLLAGLAGFAQPVILNTELPWKIATHTRTHTSSCCLATSILEV